MLGMTIWRRPPDRQGILMPLFTRMLPAPLLIDVRRGEHLALDDGAVLKSVREYVGTFAG